MDWSKAITTLGILSAIALGWISLSKQNKKDVKTETKEETAASVTLQSDVGYIRRAVDDIKLDLRAQASKLDTLTERVVRVEESTRQAHERISAMEK